MRAHPLTCLVLRKRDLGERDRIVTLLSRERGKLDAVVKGARKPGSKSSGASEVFTEARVQYSDGRSLGIVTQWDIVRPYAELRTNLGMLARAAYMCEVTERMVGEGEPCPETYDLLSAALTLLQMAHGDPDTVVRAFVVRLLGERGYGLSLDVCVRCGAALEPGRGLALSPALGGVLCVRCSPSAADRIRLDSDVMPALRDLAGASLERLAHLTLSPAAGNQTDRCLRACLRYRCESDIRSERFLSLVRDGEA